MPLEERIISKETLSKAQSRRGRLIPLLLSGLVLSVSLASTYGLYRLANEDAQHNLLANFDFRVRETKDRIEQRMAAYEQVLRGVKGLFASSATVERDEFRTYVGELDLAQHFPGIQGVGFALIVTNVQKNKHIADLRRQGFTDYAIRPDGERELYTSIIYLEPFSGRNLRAFGYDMYAEPVRRAAMERARDSGKASISGRVTLVQETEHDVQAGFLMYLPVYKYDAPHDTLETRRANILGWVYSPFRMGDLMTGLEGEHKNDFDLEIYDGAEPTAQTLMYDGDHQRTSGLALVSSLQTFQTINIASHPWTLAIRSLPVFDARINKYKPQFIATYGMVLGLLLSLLTWMLASSRGLAVALAADMTRELRESEERFRSICVSAQDAILMMDHNGNISYWNAAAETILGYSAEEALGKALHKLLAPECFHEDFRKGFDLYKKNGDGPVIGKTLELVALRKNGEEFPVEVSFAAVTIENNLNAIGILRDISERKHMEEELRRVSNTDFMTGLSNRRHFMGDLGYELARVRRFETPNTAVLMLDLDYFKRVNDDFGHATGDEMLRHVSAILTDSLRRIDRVGRLGGEEFAILLVGANINSAQIFAERLRQEVEATPLQLDGQEVPMTVSIGIAELTVKDAGPDDALNRADKALYRAKNGGRNRVEVESS